MDEYMTVVWNHLDIGQKHMIVGLFNNMNDMMPGHDAAGATILLWSSCEVWHPLAGYDAEGQHLLDEEGCMWDAVMEATPSGGLLMFGASGPSGQKPFLQEILPEDTKIRFSVRVGTKRARTEVPQ